MVPPDSQKDIETLSKINMIPEKTKKFNNKTKTKYYK